jgi:hypothetical protein
VQRVQKFIQADRKITIDSVATAVGRSRGLAYSIIHDHLKFGKVRTRWLPTELKDRETMNRIGLSLQHLLRYADEEDTFNKIVAGDQSWMHHHQSESKGVSMQWKYPSSPSAKKLKV